MKNTILGIIGILVIFLQTSCIKFNKTIYLQPSSDQKTYKTDGYSYKVQKGDVLSIKVYSYDQDAMTIFNRDANMKMLNSANEASLYLMGYEIDTKGTIELPIVGNLYLENLSLEQIRDTVNTQLTKYFKEFTVDVKLINFRVSVLGEVAHPGTQILYNPNLNILQVLGMFGGFTDYANPEKLRIFDSKTGIFTELSLKDDNIVNSEYFYVKSNMVIYVEPLKQKAYGFHNKDIWTKVITGVSAATSLLVYIFLIKTR